MRKGTPTPPIMIMGRKMACPKRLNGGHGPGEHRDDKPHPEEGEADGGKRNQFAKRVRGKRRPVKAPREAELEKDREKHDDVSGNHGADDEAGSGRGQETVTPPDAALALADHAGGHAKAGARPES